MIRARRAAAALLVLLVSPATAQETESPAGPVVLAVAGPDQTQVLVLANGSELVGRIVEVGVEHVRFLSGSMELTVPIREIRAVRAAPAAPPAGSAAWFPTSNRTRLFFAPTARPLPRGSGYVADHLFFFPSVAYGITDRFTLGAGLSLFPGVALHEQLAFVTPKVGWQVGDRTHFAVGALFAAFPRDAEEDPNRAGIAYSVGTWGEPDASLTAGFGYGFTNDGLAERPMVVLGGERRVSRRIALVTENWMFPGLEGPLVSGGVRFLGERISVDLALARALGEEDAWLPLLSFVFAFGER